MQQGQAVWENLQSKISDGAKSILNNGFSIDNGGTAGGSREPEIAPQFEKDLNGGASSIPNIIRNEHSILVKPSAPNGSAETKDLDKAGVPNSAKSGDSLNQNGDAKKGDSLNKAHLAKSSESQNNVGEAKRGEQIKSGESMNESQPDAKKQKDIDDWNKKVDEKLGNTEAGRLMKELGKALITGDQASLEQFQKMMQKIQFDSKDDNLREKMYELETDLSKQLDAVVSLHFGEAENGKMQLESLSVAEPRQPHQFHARVTVPREGSIQANDTFVEGYAGPIVSPISVAAATSRIFGERKK